MKKILYIASIMLIASEGKSQSWNLNGNAGIDPVTQFLGTTDTKPIIFKIEEATKQSGYDFSGVAKPKSDTDLYSLSYESFVVATGEGDAGTAGNYPVPEKAN